jgi:hypothetical protein
MVLPWDDWEVQIIDAVKRALSSPHLETQDPQGCLKIPDIGIGFKGLEIYSNSLKVTI